VISGVLLIVAIGGLVFEYHLRPSDHWGPTAGPTGSAPAPPDHL